MIEIREVEDKDIIPLSEFLPQGFQYTTKEFWLSLFELWWIANPAYTDLIPRGWVLEKDATLVGFIGNIPVKFFIHGTTKIAAASNSWFVVPSFRGIFSMSLLNEFVKQKGISLFLFKCNDNENLKKILSKYIFFENILPLSQKEYVYVLEKRKLPFILLKFLYVRKISKFSDLLKLHKRFGFLFFGFLYQKPVIQSGILNDPEYISSLCNSCDDDFSRLWDPHMKNYDVMISRDTQTLNWLYFSLARIYKRIVIQCHRSQDKTLVGYMVFDIIQKNPSEQGVMQLLEMCIENNDPQILSSIISFAIEIGKQNNAVLLKVWASNPAIEKYFHSTFTLRRSTQHYRYIKISEIKEMNLNIYNYNKFYLPFIYPPQ